MIPLSKVSKEPTYLKKFGEIRKKDRWHHKKLRRLEIFIVSAKRAFS